MNMKGLQRRLGESGLSLVWDVDRKFISIGNPNFANPLIWFDPRLPEKDYRGTVKIKSINSPLFSESQIRNSLMLVDTFLQTPLGDRDVN
ncbi:hypothetical protein [Oceanobacillus oncorhynchi]|uniref:hypothetical protein n=1 Tax=Oceanobacillus oncorhynchi TaxID=545501 RepID=UPI0034D6DE82